MKANSNFILRQIADCYVLLPIGKATFSLDGMITLNETSVMLWKMLEKDTTCEVLADALVAEYGIDRNIALQDVEEFVSILKKTGCIIE